MTQYDATVFLMGKPDDYRTKTVPGRPDQEPTGSKEGLVQLFWELEKGDSLKLWLNTHHAEDTGHAEFYNLDTLGPSDAAKDTDDKPAGLQGKSQRVDGATRERPKRIEIAWRVPASDHKDTLFTVESFGTELVISNMAPRIDSGFLPVNIGRPPKMFRFSGKIVAFRSGADPDTGGEWVDFDPGVVNKSGSG